MAARSCNPGIWAALGSSLIWGTLPLYWNLLRDVSPLLILCHRVVWSCFFLILLVLMTRRMLEVTKAIQHAAILRALFCSSLILAFNWGVFIWAVNNGKVVESSLGYFISPLITICLGVLFFRDKPGRTRWIAIIIAAMGVLAEVVIDGTIPWVGITLSVSFSSYGLLRKLEPVESLPGLMIETIILFPFALAFIFWTHYTTGPTAWGIDAPQMCLLMGAGIFTSTPLILYAYGARHLPFTTLGILQYLSPLLTAIIGFTIFHEPLTLGRAVSFVAIWVALILYTVSSLRSHLPTKKKPAQAE